MDFSSLGISIDSTSAKQASTDLDSLAASAANAEASVAKLTDADGKAAAAATAATQQIQAQRDAVAAVTQEYQKAADQVNAFNSQASKPIQQPAAATPLPSVFTSNRNASIDDGSRATKAATATQQLANAEKQLATNTQAGVNAEQAIQRSYEQTVVSLNKYLLGLGKTRTEKLALDAEEKFGQGARLDNIKGLLSEIQAREQQVAALKKAGQAIEGTTRLTAGQTREFAVLGHEVLTGNFSRIPGSLIVLGERTGNLGAIASAAFSGMGVAILGTVAAIATFTAAVIEGERSALEFSRAIALSGNAAGVTRGQLTSMASTIGAIKGDSSAAKDAITAFTTAGVVGANNLFKYSSLAVDIQKTLGVSVTETVKHFAELAKDPVKASQALNEQLNYLDVAELKLIETLVEHGKQQQAVAEAQRAFASASASAVSSVQQDMDDLQGTWERMILVAGRLKQAILDIGKKGTKEDQLADLREKLAAFDHPGALQGLKDVGRLLSGDGVETKAGLKKQIDDLTASIAADEKAAAKRADTAAQNKDQIAAFETEKKYREGALTDQERLNKALEQYRENLKHLPASELPSAAQQAKEEQAIRDSILKKPKSTVGDENATLRGQVDAIKRAYEEQNNIYTNSEKILEQAHSNGLISDKEYYEAKREFVQLETQAEIKALQDENARLAASAANKRARIEQDRQINANNAKIRELEVQGATKSILISGQEEAAAKKLSESYLRLDDSVKKYVQSLEDQHQKSLHGLGLGPSQKAEQDAEIQIMDRIQQARQQLEDSRRKMTKEEKDDNQATYDSEKQSLDNYQSQALADTRDYYDQLKEYNLDWHNGVIEAFNDMHDKSMNVAATAKSSVENMMNSVTNAFESFIETGKLDWKGLADSIVKDILRVIIQIQEMQALEALGIGGGGGGGGGGGWINSLVGIAGAAFGFGDGFTPDASAQAAGLAQFGSGTQFFGGGRASGGSVDPGTIYRVNEQGPELLTVGGNTYLMMGNQGGMVTPNGQNTGGGMTQVINFINNGAVDRRTQMQLGAEVFKQSRIAYSRNG